LKGSEAEGGRAGEGDGPDGADALETGPAGPWKMALVSKSVWARSGEAAASISRSSPQSSRWRPGRPALRNCGFWNIAEPP